MMGFGQTTIFNSCSRGINGFFASADYHPRGAMAVFQTGKIIIIILIVIIMNYGFLATACGRKHDYALLRRDNVVYSETKIVLSVHIHSAITVISHYNTLGSYIHCSGIHNILYVLCGAYIHVK